jgi:hypothetical protein
MEHGARDLSYGAIVAAILMILPALPLHADVRLASVFRNGGVIQHGQPAPVWGLGAPGEKIKLTLAGVKGCPLNRSYDAVADRHGKWVVTLDPLTGMALT